MTIASPPAMTLPPTDRGALERPDADLETTALFAGRSELTIRHAGQLYRLRITRAGKLILTK
jgi:hemin uptake protein HemP